jgi:hypothetical protein
MRVPKNVFYFEVLLYASLTLDALSIAFQDRTPDPDVSDTTVMAANVVAGCMLVLFVWLVSHAAQGRKSWPRWVLVASLVFSVLSLIQILGVVGLQLDSFIEIISCALTAAGLYFAFTGDARDWFNA